MLLDPQKLRKRVGGRHAARANTSDTRSEPVSYPRASMRGTISAANIMVSGEVLCILTHHREACGSEPRVRGFTV